MSVEIISYGNPIKGSTASVANANIELLMRVTAQAKVLTPIKSGFLRGSIMWKVPGKTGGHEKGNVLQAKPDEGNGLVGSAMEYAIYVEFGTRYQAAQPYLRPAIIIEVFGPNGQNVMAKESFDSMKQALSQGGKKYEF